MPSQYVCEQEGAWHIRPEAPAVELAGDEIGLGERLDGEGYSLSTSCDLAFTHIHTHIYLKQRWTRESDPISDASYFHPTTSEDFKARKAAHNRQVTLNFSSCACF